MLIIDILTVRHRYSRDLTLKRDELSMSLRTFSPSCSFGAEIPTVRVTEMYTLKKVNKKIINCCKELSPDWRK